MPLVGQYEPSPDQRTREQVEAFEASGGAENSMFGIEIVVITMQGASSGKLRKIALMRVEHDGCYAAVASKGGAPEHPVWYRNMTTNPLVELHDGPVRRDYRARELSGAERDQWWERSVAVFPPYAEYEQRTDRLIPVFVLEPVTD